MRLAKTATTVFFVRIAASVLQIIGLAYFARELGGALLGAFVLFQAVTQMLTTVTDFGIGGAVEKRLSEGTSLNVISTALVVKTGILSLLAPVVILLSGLLNTYFGSELALYLVPVLFFDQIGRTFLRTLRGELRVREATLLELFQRLVFVVTGIILVFLGYEIVGLIGAMLLGWIVVILQGYDAIATDIGRPSKEAFQSVVDFAKYNYISSVLGRKAYSWIDTLIIGLLMTQTSVAAYEIAWRITVAVTMLSQAISSTVFPQISEWDANDDTIAIERMVPDALMGALLLVIPAVFGVALLGEDILRLIFGEEFTVATLAFVILMLGKIPESINNVVSQILLGMDRPALVARAVVLFIVLNVVLNIVLTTYYGLAGAATATTLSFSIMLSLILYDVSKLINLQVAWLDHTISLFAALGMAGGLLIFQMVVDIDSLVRLVGVIGIGALLYFVLLLIPKRTRKRTVELTHSVIK